MNDRMRFLALMILRERGERCVLRCESTKKSARDTAGCARRFENGTAGEIDRPIYPGLTLELVTVGDFALPVAGLFVQVKGQSAGTRDLLQAGPCTPVGGERPPWTENKKGCLRESNA